MKKLSRILVIAMCFAMILSTCVFAEEGGAGGFDITVGANPLTGASGMVSSILGMIQWIGYAIAVGMLIYIGIKYVTASANDKAELKNAMVKYVVGAILIAAASTIAGFIFNATWQ